MSDALFLTPLIVMVVAIVAAFVWWVLSDKRVSDDSLFDFLDQTGYSVQHLATGWWAVTDGSQKLVGQPARCVRDAVLSAVDAQVV